MTEPHGYCLATGVEAGRRALEVLCTRVGPPTVAIGYDAKLSGRSGYAPLSKLAKRYSFPLVETIDINSAEVIDAVERLRPALLVVAGWSQIVGSTLLGLFPSGAVGLHPTRLPQGSGRAPIPWTIINGLTDTAVTLFHLTEVVDAGDIVAAWPVQVYRRDDAKTLYDRIADAHGYLLVEHLPALLAGSAPRRRQEGSGSQWTRRRPEDGVIDWALPAAKLYDWVRALTHPYPGSFTNAGDHVLRVWAVDLLPESLGVEAIDPGIVIGPVWSVGEGGVVVATGSGLLTLRSVSIGGGPDRLALDLWESGELRTGERLG